MTLSFKPGDRVRLTGPSWKRYEVAPVSAPGVQHNVGDVVTISQGHPTGGWFSVGPDGTKGFVSSDSGSSWGGVLIEAAPVDREPVALGEVADAALLEMRNRQARTLGYADGLLDRSPVTATGADPAYDLGYQEGYTARTFRDH